MVSVGMPEPTRTHRPGSTFIAFDFGLSRIGVAVGQSITGTASALETVRYSRTPDWTAIARVVREWKPSGLVVGLPLGHDDGETEMSRAARRFGAELSQRFGMPVHFCDERLTSKSAGQQFAAMRARGQSRRGDASKLDALAAKIMLEAWMAESS